MSATSPSSRALSPPPSISSPTTTTTTTAALPSSHTSQSQAQPQLQAQMPAHQHIHPTLPSAENQRHVAEARAAVVASMGNMVDAQLQSRASVLHDNARALDKQERDVLAATAGLRREREKLSKEADGAARRLKEVGNVQNWAEVLEQKFNVLDETVRLANGGRSVDGSMSGSGGSDCSCSCSECGGDEQDGEDRTVDGMNMDMDMDMDDERKNGFDDKGKGKMKDAEGMMALDSDEGIRTAWSDASRSLNEPESSTGTGMAKGSETASVSTSS